MTDAAVSFGRNDLPAVAEVSRQMWLWVLQHQTGEQS